MSNGDDVQDNWEEIDEVELTNTVTKIQEETRIQKLKEENFLNRDTSITTPAINHLYSSLTSNNLNSVNQRKEPVMKLLQRTPNAEKNDNHVTSESLSDLPSPLNTMASSLNPIMMVLHKPTDEYQAANYTQPINSQTVKILRRPTQSSDLRNNDVRPKQPIKTLQQREQEYAEARLRIMGSAKPPPEVDNTPVAQEESSIVATSIPPITTTNNVATSQSGINFNTNSQNVYMNNHYQHKQQQLQQQHQQQHLINMHHPIHPEQQCYYPLLYRTFNNRSLAMPPNIGQALITQPQQHQHPPLQMQQTWSPVVGGSVSSSILRQQQQQQQQQESILRLPRGPDGSTGFQVRR